MDKIQELAHEETIKALDTIAGVLKSRLEELPKEIAEKLPDITKLGHLTVTVDNQPEQNSLIVPDEVTATIKNFEEVIGKLDEVTAAIKESKQASIELPEIAELSTAVEKLLKRDTIVKVDAPAVTVNVDSVSVDNWPKDAKDPLAVRLSNGEFFISQLTKAVGGVASFRDSDKKVTQVQLLSNGSVPTSSAGIQPDGDTVYERADGDFFTTTNILGSGETFESDWYDSDGFRSISIVVAADQESATNGVYIEYTGNAQASTPDVDATDTFTFDGTDVVRGFKRITLPPSLDGFRVRYTNGATAQTDFHLVATGRTVPVEDIRAGLNTEISDSSAAALRRSVLTARKPNDSYTNIEATAGGNLKVSVQEISDGLDIGNGDAGAETQRVVIASDQSVDIQHDIRQGLNEILSTYGADVSVNGKAKSLLKFGRNPNVGTVSTGYTIWSTGADQANETYVATNINSIDKISSSSASDTQQVVIEGHTESGSNKTFVVQTATLNGQNKVTLTTPLNRVTRIYNNGSTDFAGAIYVYEDTAIVSGKPSDTTKIHCGVALGHNQSEKASTSLSSGDYWLITNFYAGNVTKATTSTSTDVRLQIRRNGKVFREVSTLTVGTADENTRQFDPFIIAPANSDIRLVAVSTAGNQEIVGGIQGYLAS